LDGDTAEGLRRKKKVASSKNAKAEETWTENLIIQEGRQRQRALGGGRWGFVILSPPET